MYMLADKGSMLTPPECELYYLTKMIIYDNNGSMVTDMSKYLYEEIYGKALHLYTNEKYGIDMDTICMIDCKAVGEALEQYIAFKCKKIIQLINSIFYCRNSYRITRITCTNNY